jgi:hypothetical protein
MKDRYKAYRMDKKYDSTSNDRVRKLALIDSIKAFVDKEVYDEVTAVRCTPGCRVPVLRSADGVCV